MTRRVRIVAAALVVVALLLCGCGSVDPEPHQPRVSNATGETVRLSLVANGLTTPLSTIGAGVTVGLIAFEGTCTRGVLVASSLTGEEVDRRAEPLCADETWTIGGSRD